MSRFKDERMQKVYRAMLLSRPTERRTTLSSAFVAGYHGYGGVNKGVPTSLVRAAWTAGRDAAKIDAAAQPADAVGSKRKVG